METVKYRSMPNNKSKLARTFRKVINLKTATRIASNNGIGMCELTPGNRFEDRDHPSATCKFHQSAEKSKIGRHKRRAVLEALMAKLFAGVSTTKAAYAQLQMAQNPYNSDNIRAADQAIVDEFKQLSELKREYFKNDLDHVSPQVTIMLAEIQEQQSLMKTYEVTIKKLEAEVEVKDSDFCSLKKQLDEYIAYNKSLEKRLSFSGPIPLLDDIKLSSLNPGHFVQFLHFTLRSMRSFVKLMVREMELACWDLDAAVRAIEPKTTLAKPSHRCFVFESFVSKTLLEGFNRPQFTTQNECAATKKSSHEQHYFNEFKKIKSLNLKLFLTQNPNSALARFTRTKYTQLVHAKMEWSLFGNLNQRKLVNAGGFPDSAFFNAFAEMARRVWSLNLLAFSLGEQVSIFQVGKNLRFSEVYMESITDESLLDGAGNEMDLRVEFTVVPGFKINKMVIQSQVYLSPVV
ncbi:hypothetical protein K2173_006652 [Erythroxylum novogranatense]|uniref:DUF641 domain-containing protein n=1 Tax=Erythroxylum novogranatense TaxID=1862640 RepID=A0AAV8T718_9ROSI|nr:hypothetical protein K2173_006652 [Erythroxylum novogranatense]